MGDIAESLIEAEEDGRDPHQPNFDGWGEFDEEPYILTATDLGVSARMMLCEYDDIIEQAGIDPLGIMEQRADAIMIAIPAFPIADAQRLVGLLEQLSNAANAMGDKEIKNADPSN